MRGLIAIALGLIACVLTIAGWVLLLAVGGDYFVMTFPVGVAAAVFAGLSVAIITYSCLCRG